MKDLKEVSLFVVVMITSSSIWLAEATVAINQTDHVVVVDMTDLTNMTTTPFDESDEITSSRRITSVLFTVFTLVIVALISVCYGYCILQTIRSWCCLPEEFDLDEQERRKVLEYIFSATSKTVTENTFPKKKKAKPHDATSVTKPEKKQEGEDHPTDIEIPKGTTPREANEKLDDIPLDLEVGSLVSHANKLEVDESTDGKYTDSLDQVPSHDDKLNTKSASDKDATVPVVLPYSKSFPPRSSSTSLVAAGAGKYSPGTQGTPQFGTIARICRSLSWKQKANEKDGEYDEEESVIETETIANEDDILGHDEEKGEDEKTPSKPAAAVPAKSLGEDDDDDDTDENVCAICISGYEPGDVVVSSKYCKHVFHKECILEWLGKHDMCPCCRVDMVTDTDMNKAAMKVVGQTKIMKLVQSMGLLPSSSPPLPPPPSSNQGGQAPTTTTSHDSNNDSPS